MVYVGSFRNSTYQPSLLHQRTSTNQPSLLHGRTSTNQPSLLHRRTSTNQPSLLHRRTAGKAGSRSVSATAVVDVPGNSMPVRRRSSATRQTRSSGHVATMADRTDASSAAEFACHHHEHMSLQYRGSLSLSLTHTHTHTTTRGLLDVGVRHGARQMRGQTCSQAIAGWSCRFSTSERSWTADRSGPRTVDVSVADASWVARDYAGQREAGAGADIHLGRH